MTVEPITAGDYGDYIVTYEADLVRIGTEICNLCTIDVVDDGQTTSLFPEVYAQQNIAS